MRRFFNFWHVKFHKWHSRRAMSPQAWAEHRRAIEDASKYDDDMAIERQCEAVKGLVARLEIAADVGSQEARHRLRRLRLDPIGAEAARAAGEALRRLDVKMMAGS